MTRGIDGPFQSRYHRDKEMCAIAGFVVRGRDQPEEVLERMGESMAHRGPDDPGIFRASTADGAWQVGIVHRRLSIIDLSTGHQPLGNEDGTIQVVFNGEIYNFEALRRDLALRGHRFVTRSDTEVITVRTTNCRLVSSG